MFLNVP
ncbi:hypothetical protein D020_0232A, partial [Vibrio parahaemolyticus SBR10290]